RTPGRGVGSTRSGRLPVAGDGTSRPMVARKSRSPSTYGVLIANWILNTALQSFTGSGALLRAGGSLRPVIVNTMELAPPATADMTSLVTSARYEVWPSVTDAEPTGKLSTAVPPRYELGIGGDAVSPAALRGVTVIPLLKLVAGGSCTTWKAAPT